MMEVDLLHLEEGDAISLRFWGPTGYGYDTRLQQSSHGNDAVPFFVPYATFKRIEDDRLIFSLWQGGKLLTQRVDLMAVTELMKKVG